MPWPAHFMPAKYTTNDLSSRVLPRHGPMAQYGMTTDYGMRYLVCLRTTGANPNTSLVRVPF